MHRHWIAISCVLAVASLALGCSKSESSVTTNEMNADFKHNHRHQHGPGHDHEHSHDETVTGGHSHPHTHGHRHGDPLYGGRIVSIGHSHHAKGATHYHAEVMPTKEGLIRFHVLVEDEKGRSKALPIEATEIVAYIDRFDQESPRAREVLFRQEESSESGFVAEVPEDYRDAPKLSVVVPKIKLGGERLNFSFTATSDDESDEPQEAAVESKEPAA